MRKQRVDFSAIKILKGVPIPPKHSYESWGPVFNRMETGDSFRLDAGILVQSAIRAAKNLGVKVTTRKMEKGGWMIWRLK